MKYFLVALLYISATLTFESKAAQVIYCDNCSISQVESKVKRQTIENNYLVIDFQSQRAYLYEWFIAEREESGKMTFYTKLWKKNIAPNIDSTLTEFFSYRQQFLNSLSSNPNVINELLKEVTTMNYSGSEGGLGKADSWLTSSAESGTGETTPYEFMTTSSLRKQVFDRMVNYYPNAQNALNAWNSFAQFASVSVGPASVSSAWLTIPQTISFSDSGYLQVVISPSGDTFNVVAGSAFDSSGNQIPDNQKGFVGNFTFNTSASQTTFRNYGSYYNIEFAVGNTCFNDYRTSCVQTSSNRYICTLRQIC
ncbi:MAG: hypothetical protein ACI8WB_000198 [Phenylobacterium sp.]|jgi:hypothetical protein